MPSFKSLLLFTATALADTVIFEVGEKGLTITPSNATAKVGDTVIFKLHKAHDVAQGPFDKPCNPLDGGFYSGPYANTEDGKKRFVMNVTSTDPMYFYCTVSKHCQNGMVAGINIPTGDKDTTAYAAAAAKVDSSVVPKALSGGELLDDAAIASLTSSAAPSGTVAPPASSSTPSGSVNGASTTPTPTGGAANMGVNMGLAAAVGAMAWVL